ncbi:MAG: hypothetical protein JRI80_04965 [Deltaproteobacteria bacterium]|nr:hypothetical protein [Deltaproteobacteria bacterium]
MKVCHLFSKRVTVSRPFLFILFAVAIGLGAHSAYAQNMALNTGFNYIWWESNQHEKGTEVSVPLSIEGDYRDVQFRVLTGYLYGYHDARGIDSHRVKDLLDTKLNFSYAFEDVGGFTVLAGLDFNVPTGRSELHEKDTGVLVDPDLVPITSWGEGFNVNPTVVILKSWDEILVGLGGGYLRRGSYDYSNDFEDYDPGDIWRMTGEIRYYPDQYWGIRAFSSYNWYGKDTLHGDDYYQPGDMLEAGLGISFERAPWQFKIDFSSFFRQKEETQAASGDLTEEDKNSYGNEFQVKTSATYDLSDTYALLGVVNFLHIEPNDYQREDSLYRGTRRKIEAGVGLQWKYSEKYQVKALGTYFTLHDHETPDHPDSSRTYRGVTFQAGLITRF